MPLQLYEHPFAIVPWRVRIALAEKGLEFESIETNLYTQPPTPEFLALNPFAQIPVLIDGNLVISESIAILEYLEETHPAPPLMPSNAAERARVRNLLCWATDYWPPAWQKWMAPRLPKGVGDAWTEDSVASGRQAICDHIDVLDAQLQDREWLVDDFSLADVGYAPFVLVLDRVDLGGETEARPNVRRWLAQLNARPSIIATMMPPSP